MNNLNALIILDQRWSPREHILKSLALASSPRKLANLRLEDSIIFWIVKILWSAWKIFWKAKNFCEDLFFFFFFWRAHLRLCPWSLALASSYPVLGLESVCPRKGCPWPWPRIFFVSLALALSLVSSTPPLSLTCTFFNRSVIEWCWGQRVCYQNGRFGLISARVQQTKNWYLQLPVWRLTIKRVVCNGIKV